VDLLIKNARIASPEGIVDGAILIDEGRFAAVKKSDAGLTAENSVDAQGKLFLPGLIDAHVHFRTPGSEYKEDWKTGPQAAAAGGVTTVLDMPNTNPPTTTLKDLADKRKKAEKKSIVDFGLHMGATNDNLSEIEKAWNIASVKFYLGSTTGPLLFDTGNLRTFLEVLEEKGITATAHCESEELIGKLAEQAREGFKFYSQLRTPQCELESMRDFIEAVRYSDARAHICHVSSRAGVEFLRKSKSPNISAEATPHHLFLTEEDEKRLGALGKMNPPLRSPLDRKTLWQALVDGTIDIVATDHAPHTREEKEKGFLEAPAGVPGVETRLPLLLEQVNRGNLTIERLVQSNCTKPAEIFGILNKGRIAEGYDADFIVIDLEHKHEIKNDELFTKCGWSPFDGAVVRGKVMKTFVRGQCVYEDGECLSGDGKEVSFGRPE